MEFSFWGACGIGGAGKSDKVITEGASKALPERCKQKNPPFENSGFRPSKDLHNFKNRVWGVAPSGVRAAAPHSAPSHGEGVFGKDAEIRTHQALHEAKPSECPKGDRD